MSINVVPSEGGSAPREPSPGNLWTEVRDEARLAESVNDADFSHSNDSQEGFSPESGRKGESSLLRDLRPKEQNILSGNSTNLQNGNGEV